MLKLNIICFLRAEQIKSSIILRSLFLIFEWQLCKRRYASCHIGGTFFVGILAIIQSSKFIKNNISAVMLKGIDLCKENCP